MWLHFILKEWDHWAGEDVSGRLARLLVEALNVDEDEVSQAATLAEARKAERGGGGGAASLMASPNGWVLRLLPAGAERRPEKQFNRNRAAACSELFNG